MKYLFAICLSEKILYFCRKQTEQLMKILHTADWHLGQTFYEYDRREEHFHFLEWLKQQIKQHEIDVLLIAGDVFDSPNPSAESQRVYYRFLREVTSENPSLQIVIIALLACVAAVLGIYGDLFASVVKRQCGIKDYGTIFPGHGGILDRFDSVMFIAPFVTMVVIAVFYH